MDLDALFAQLKATLAQQGTLVDVPRLDEVFTFARIAHADQRRDSGEPYLVHPLAVAQIVAELGLDQAAVEGALLHDVAEDTSYGLDTISQRFGPAMAQLVDGVTKLMRLPESTTNAGVRDTRAEETIRKMFLAMAEDIRVVFIKLADRLHNMRTLDSLPIERRERIARQTREIYAPLAERLGIWQLKWELEDRAFKALEPEAYHHLAELLEVGRAERENYIARVREVLANALAEAGIEAQIDGRPKHLWSIYSKMRRKEAALEEIYDLYALRVLVADTRDCYGALGVVHSLWYPIPEQFDDYIATPKNNFYQSLHTAVIALEGRPLEVQIRTQTMHEAAEMGIAAHWRYKDPGGKADSIYAAKLAWLRQLLDWQRDVADASEFVEGLKLDVFQDQVFVFTPAGDVRALPAGANPLDFAYLIHTEVGHHCIGARVNNRLVPLDTALHSGDIVEILTTRTERGPSRDWLGMVTTAHAREKIRSWFKHQQRDDNVASGRASLERELKRLLHSSIERMGTPRLIELAHEHSYDTLDDLFAAIGYGAVSAAQIAGRLGVTDDEDHVLLPQSAPRASSVGVRVKGVGELMLRFVGCCQPAPGDKIIGFISRGRGIAVHRADCKSLQAEDEERLVELEWESAGPTTYPVTVRIEGRDRPGLLADITRVLAEDHVNILAADVRSDSDGNALVNATLALASVDHLTHAISRIEALRDIDAVSRA